MTYTLTHNGEPVTDPRPIQHTALYGWKKQTARRLGVPIEEIDVIENHNDDTDTQGEALEEYTVAELKEICLTIGIPHSGRKQELIERIRQHTQEL